MTHRQQLFYNYLAQTSDFPLALDIERAEGVYLYGTQGEQYIDFISGIGVSNVGHRHPKVIAAIQAQLDKYLHLMVYGEYIETPQVKLAEALVQTLPHPSPPCDGPTLLGGERTPFQQGRGQGVGFNVYFTNSGTEAVEGAMKLAKRYTGRKEFVSCFNAYHGATQGALSLAGAEFFKRNFRPLLPGVKHITHGSLEDLDKIGCRTAAVVIEVIGGEAGVRVPDVAYHQALRQRCTDVGALLIYDEIQTGFGRTGTFWAFEQYGVLPDILLTAKGMGGGMPIGAFMAPQHIMSVFKNNPILGHITTFGGHPVSCAASLATLEIVQQLLAEGKSQDVPSHFLSFRQQEVSAPSALAGTLNLDPNKRELAIPTNPIQAKSDLIRSLLIHPKIKEIRGRGLMMAVEFESFEVLKPIIDRAISRGVITDWFLFCDNSMRIAPPLTITDEQIHTACQIILEAIEG
ncbi:MAG: aspartate aminotransferase family protein [Spirosomaceae bacterium]|nr:aspartate aminotransferase family protein [Spirosomataceae bacterium]